MLKWYKLHLLSCRFVNFLVMYNFLKPHHFYSTIMFLKTFNKLANKLFTKKLIQATFNLESPADIQNETSKKKQSLLCSR